MKRIFYIAQTTFLQVTLLFFMPCHGQSRFTWPQDSIKAKELHALYTDALKRNDYKSALNSISWLLEMAPELNPSIYIHAEKIYKNLIVSEKDSTQRHKLQMRQLEIYDQRIKYFGNRGKVINRKAYWAYRYFKDKPDKYQELFKLFEEAFSFDEQHILTANIVAYMNVIRLYKSSGAPLDNNKILQSYHFISSLIEARGLENKNQVVVDRLLAATITIDCTIIENELSKFYRQDTSNVVLAKRVMQLCLAYDCKGASIFLTAAKTVQNVEPSSALALMLAVLMDKNGDKQSAERYYLEATELSTDPNKTAKAFYSLALHYQHRGMKKKSRTAALECTKHDPGMRKAFKLIGDLYWTSAEDCKQGKSRTYDRAFYIAAYDMYKKAGDTVMMEQALKQFPSMDDIFYEKMAVGQTLHLECWLNKTVRLQKRPAR